MIAAFFLIIFAFCMVAACVSDLLTQKISNKLNLVLLGAFVLVLPFSGLSGTEMVWHVAIGLVTLVVAYLLFSLGVIGAGDAKFMAATAPWLGLGAMSPYVFAFGVIGGLLCLAMLMARQYLIWDRVVSIPWVENWLCNKTGSVPYGVALGPAGLYAVTESPIFKTALAAF